MEFSPLELGLVVAAVFIVFGPKRLPKSKSSKATGVTRAAKVDTTYLRPAYYGAGRAPSPLTTSGKPAQREFQFATADREAAPLPHEFYWN